MSYCVCCVWATVPYRRYAISEKAGGAAAAVKAEAAAFDEKHGLADKAAAAKLAAAAKAAELDEKTGASEKAAAAKAAASAKAKELDEKHGISEQAAAARDAAVAKVNELDQKAAAKYIDGYVGHTTTLEFKCKEGKVGVDEWIEWSKTEDGLPFTKSQKGCSLVQLFTTETGICAHESTPLSVVAPVLCPLGLTRGVAVWSIVSCSHLRGVGPEGVPGGVPRSARRPRRRRRARGGGRPRTGAAGQGDGADSGKVRCSRHCHVHGRRELAVLRRENDRRGWLLHWC